MRSNYETFFDHPRFALVGRSAAKPFPLLSYRGLKRHGKTVYAVDPSAQEIDGDPAYPDLTALPEAVEALIIEAPKQETRDWIAAAAQAGIQDVWVHMAHDTPEAIALAEESGINLRTGTCAVMYVTRGLSYHSLHKAIMKLAGKY
ncbi:CoA-binding protein [Halochromatium glycolicum]|jgi:predicted CoA-binding protein|uniref:CoA-binding protein n=1 Tax=Halochromatium glycolicum TaxID=85075 RepID=A0AAJ0U4M3_9GAMM|nr:CoA-binding protein [Halochromatium glycolicum]MBK1704727.1 CoA-binding protein [Halochromatium glycolicum]